MTRGESLSIRFFNPAIDSPSAVYLASNEFRVKELAGLLAMQDALRNSAKFGLALVRGEEPIRPPLRPKAPSSKYAVTN
jgi:hypothetical protein